jgi:hypothetical protein
MSNRDAVGVAFQGDIATKNATMAAWPQVTSESLAPTRDTLSIDETTGTRAPEDIDLGAKSYAGSIDGAARPASFPYFVTGAMGYPGSTAPAAGVGLHTWDPLAAGKSPVPLSIMTINNDPDTPVVDLFYGCMVDSLEMSVEPNDYLMFKAAMIAIGLDDTQSAPSITRDATSKFRFSQVTAQISVNGVALADIDLARFACTYGNSMDPDEPSLGSTEIDDIKEGNISVGCSFTPKDGLSEHYRRVLKDSPDAVRIVVKATGAMIGETEYPYYVEWDIKKLRYTDAPMDINASSVTKSIDVTASGVYDAVSGQVVVVKIQNATAGYSAPS